MIIEEIIFNIFMIFTTLLIIDAVLISVIKRLLIYFATMFDHLPRMPMFDFSDSTFKESIAKFKEK